MISKLDSLLIKCITDKINKTSLKDSFNFSYHTQIYELKDIIGHILFILKTGNSWKTLDTLKLNDYKSIKGTTVYACFRKINSYNIFDKTYIQLLEKYIKRTPANKLKIQSTDTTFIRNKYGSEKVGRNKQMKGKNVTKISAITDSNGVVLNLFITAGNHNDSKIIQSHLDNMLIDVTKNNIYKKYFLGDKGYCSYIFRKMLIDRCYIPIIDYNNRNTKNPEKIKSLSKDELKIYKNRIKIEHTFGKLKSNCRRIDTRYDNKLDTYNGFVFMGNILHILNVMINNGDL